MRPPPASRLLLVDATPTLFVIAPGKTPAPVTLRGAKDLKSIAAIATYSGNLYLLDPQGGEVWRYLPGGDGFDSERSALLGGVDINDARGFAVDGDLYIFGASSVRHFRPPRELPPLPEPGPCAPRFFLASRAALNGSTGASSARSSPTTSSSSARAPR